VDISRRGSGPSLIYSPQIFASLEICLFYFIYIITFSSACEVTSVIIMTAVTSYIIIGYFNLIDYHVCYLITYWLLECSFSYRIHCAVLILSFTHTLLLLSVFFATWIQHFFLFSFKSLVSPYRHAPLNIQQLNDMIYQQQLITYLLIRRICALAARLRRIQCKLCVMMSHTHRQSTRLFDEISFPSLGNIGTCTPLRRHNWLQVGPNSNSPYRVVNETS